MKKLFLLLLIVFASVLSFAQVRTKVVIGNDHRRPVYHHQHRYYHRRPVQHRYVRHHYVRHRRPRNGVTIKANL